MKNLTKEEFQALTEGMDRIELFEIAWKGFSIAQDVRERVDEDGLDNIPRGGNIHIASRVLVEDLRKPEKEKDRLKFTFEFFKEVPVIVERGEGVSAGGVLDLGTIKFAEHVTVTKDWTDKIGECFLQLSEEEKKLVVGFSDLNLDPRLISDMQTGPGEGFVPVYPAVGVTYMTIEGQESDGKIKNATIDTVSLCGTPNADPNIKPVYIKLAEK